MKTLQILLRMTLLPAAFLVIPMVASAQTLSSEAQKLLASDGAASDEFGSSVSISGDVAIVGASVDGDNGNDSGSAFIYEKQPDGSWLETSKLLASDGAAEAVFGTSVSISGDMAIVGAPYHQDNGITTGSAYIFEKQPDGSWLETSKLLASDGAAFDEFGISVSISGDVAIVGALFSDGVEVSDLGSAYVFEKQSDGSWLETSKLLASDGVRGDQFGCSVSISGDALVVGARREEDNLGFNSGAAYIFEKQSDGSWLETDKLLASDGADNDEFGLSVSISGDVVIAGAFNAGDQSIATGAAYIFDKQADGSWLETTKLLASDGAAFDDFGISVSISGDAAIVGAVRDQDNGSVSGSAYLFEKQADGSWLETSKLLPSDGAASDNFGTSVSISGDVAILGSLRGDGLEVSDVGAAYIFDFRTPQTITFEAITPVTFGDAPFTLSASTDAPLALSYASSDETVATVDAAGEVTILAGGTTDITVSQAGDEVYLPAESVVQALTVNRASQFITFSLPTEVPETDGTIALEGTASSSLPVSYSVTGPAQVDEGGTLTLNGPGELTITASQAGDRNYLPAEEVQVMLTVTEVVSVHTLAGRGMVLFPNPSFGVVNIRQTGALQISILDLQGRIIQQAQATDVASLDLSDQAPGMYIVSVNGQQQKLILK